MKKLLMLTASIALSFTASQAMAENVNKELEYVMDTAIASGNTELVTKTLINTANYHEDKTVDITLYTARKMPATERDAIADVVMVSGSDNAAMILAALYGVSTQIASSDPTLDDMQPAAAADAPGKNVAMDPKKAKKIAAAAAALKASSANNVKKSVVKNAQVAALQQAVVPATPAKFKNISYSWGANTSSRGLNTVGDVKFAASLVEKTSGN